MAHWAELDESNKVLRVLVTSNEELDEGYQWLIDTFGGNWIKTSYNTVKNQHLLGGTPLRGTYAGIDFTYDTINDRFIPPKPFSKWIFNEEEYEWNSPVPYPDAGFWIWNDDLGKWVEDENR